MPDPFDIQNFLANSIPQHGMSSGYLQQWQQYANMQSGNVNSAYSLARGGSQANTSFLPFAPGNTMPGAVYNFGHRFIDPMLQRLVTDRYDRYTSPISNTPVNFYDVMQARRQQERMGDASNLGAQTDDARSAQLFKNIQDRTGFNIGDGAGSSIGNFLTGIGLNSLQGGSFSNLNASLSRMSQVEGFGSGTARQVNDLSTIIRQQGFERNGRVGINSGFTRGLGLDQIGSAISELQARGRFNFGTDTEVGLQSSQYLDAGGNGRLFARRKEIEELLGKEGDDELSDERRNQLQQELSTGKEIARMTPMERKMAYEATKRQRRDDLMDQGFSYSKAFSQTETEATSIASGKDTKLLAQWEAGGKAKLQKSISSLLEMTQTLGDIFETAAGKAPELLRNLEAIDSSVLSTTKTTDITKILRENKYTAELTGFNTSQLAAIMTQASTMGKQYGLSFQESQENAKQNMLFRNFTQTRGYQSGYGMPTDAQAAEADLSLRTRAGASSSSNTIAQFMSGYEMRQSLGETPSKEDTAIYKAYKSGNAAEANKLTDDGRTLENTQSYRASNKFNAGEWRANNAKLASGINMFNVFENEEAILARDTAEGLIAGMSGDVSSTTTDAITDVVRSVRDTAGLSGVTASMNDEKSLQKTKRETEDALSKAKATWLASNPNASAATKSAVSDLTANNIIMRNKNAKVDRYGGDVMVNSAMFDSSKDEQRFNNNARIVVNAGMSKALSDAGMSSTFSENIINALGAEKGDLLETLLNSIAPHDVLDVASVENTAIRELGKSLGTEYKDAGQVETAAAVMSILNNETYAQYQERLDEKYKDKGTPEEITKKRKRYDDKKKEYDTTDIKLKDGTTMTGKQFAEKGKNDRESTLKNSGLMASYMDRQTNETVLTKSGFATKLGKLSKEDLTDEESNELANDLAAIVAKGGKVDDYVGTDASGNKVRASLKEISSGDESARKNYDDAYKVIDKYKGKNDTASWEARNKELETLGFNKNFQNDSRDSEKPITNSDALAKEHVKWEKERNDKATSGSDKREGKLSEKEFTLSGTVQMVSDEAGGGVPVGVIKFLKTILKPMSN